MREKWKIIIAVLLVCAFVLPLAACGEGTPTGTNPETTAPGENVTTAPVKDDPTNLEPTEPEPTEPEPTNPEPTEPEPTEPEPTEPEPTEPEPTEPPAHNHSYTTSITAPTCTEQGYTTYTCSCGYSYVDDYVPATDHAWSVTYQWSEDGKTCTATHVCGNDATHNVTVAATVASKQTKAPTCLEVGETTYTATFDVDWAATQTKTLADVPATDHAWSVTYQWSEDGKECTATHVCGNDATHNVTVTATVTSKQTKAPTCVELGETTYTATFDVDWATTQTKTLADVPATDHAWSVTYQWSEDGKECTATHVCGNDATHNVTVAATVASKQTKAPTCVELGETTYTATFDVDWAETQATTLADVPTQHQHVTATAAKKESCTEDGNSAYWYCADCDKYFNDEACTTEIEENSWFIAAHHNYKDRVCEDCGKQQPSEGLNFYEQ